MTDTAQLRALLAKMTRGTLAIIEEETDFSISGEGWFDGQTVGSYFVLGIPDNPRFAIAMIDTSGRPYWDDTEVDAYAAGIVALVNAAEPMLDEIERLRGALRHIVECKREPESDRADHYQRVALAALEPKP